MSEATVKGPQVRIRVNHKYTAKDGWRLDETTVEIEGEASFKGSGFEAPDGTGYTTPIATLLGDLSQEASAAGEAEAQRRNNADKQAKLYGPGDPDMAEVPF